LPLGGEWTTRRRTITQADLIAFVGLSGDYNPLYTDAEHARGGPYGEPVVPGTLVAAMATGLGSIDVPVPATVGMVGMTWRFVRPVRPGDTIRARWRLNRKRPVDNPRWGLAVWQIEVENQRSETVAAAEMTRLVSRREQPAEPARPGKNRRRRRRVAAEPVANHELPPKPTPGPLVEPVIKPGPEAPELQPVAEPQVAAPFNGTPSRRRRRSGRPKPEVPTEQAIAEPAATPAADLPEAYRGPFVVPPQPPAVPPASEAPPDAAALPAAPSPRRRRRRAPATRETAEPAPAAQPERPVSEPVQPEAVPSGGPSRRRRRSRAVADQVELALREPELSSVTPEPASESAPAPTDNTEPAPTHHTEAESLENGGSAGGLAGVLRRLRGGVQDHQ
jgi:3-hydroxybutyryl-CoA dehydratase